MTPLQIADLFAGRLSVMRTLREDETDALEMMIAAEGNRHFRRAWTDQDDSRMLGMKAQGMLAPQIAEQLGRTPWSIRNRVKVLRSKGALSTNSRSDADAA